MIEKTKKLDKLKTEMIDYLLECEKNIEWVKIVHSVIRYEKHLIDFEQTQKNIEEMYKG